MGKNVTLNVAGLSDVKSLVENMAAKIADGTATKLEVRIVSAIADCRDSAEGAFFCEILDACEAVNGTCPFSGSDEWPEEANDQIAYLQGIAKSIDQYIDAPLQEQAEKADNEYLSFDSMPEALLYELTIPYLDDLNPTA